MAYNFMNEPGPVDQVIVTGKTKSMSDLESEGGCSFCPSKYPLEFKDLLSFKEYKISGLCQKCQDEVFEGPAK